jgi:hypothetical protein
MWNIYLFQGISNPYLSCNSPLETSCDTVWNMDGSAGNNTASNFSSYSDRIVDRYAIQQKWAVANLTLSYYSNNKLTAPCMLLYLLSRATKAHNKTRWNVSHKAHFMTNIKLAHVSAPEVQEDYSWELRFTGSLTLILLMWSIGWVPNNARKWQMEFNSAFKGLSSE